MNKPEVYVYKAIFMLLAMVGLSACMPEALKDPAPRAWTDAQVDSVVTWDKQRIYSPLGEAFKGAPAACDYIEFLRIKVNTAPEASSDADAVFLMMPGVFEGATAFKYIGRQMAYIGKTQHNKNFEIWGLDRRSNCLEDLSIMDDAEAQSTAYEAGKMIIDYYFNKREVNGKQFAGFLTNEQSPFLAEFGLKLATEDMFTIMKTMMPNLEDRQKKLFVGGHSQGGFHTAAFLSWDLDNNPLTLDDAGYRNVAGAFGFDTLLSDFEDIRKLVEKQLPFSLVSPFLIAKSADFHKALKEGLRNNKLPLASSVPNLVDPSAVAFLPMIGAIAQVEPKAENLLLKDFPLEKSVALNNLMNVFQPPLKVGERTAQLTDFRFTNEALVGMFWDDDFAPLGFLNISLGHLHGGAVRDKNKVVRLAAKLPVLSELLGAATVTKPQFMPVDHNLEGDGPLYGWANFDEVANAEDSVYSDVLGNELTTAEDEMSDMASFIDSLHDKKTNMNFTEWYHPTRLLVDLLTALPFEHAIESGLPVWHRSRVEEVPRIEFMGEDGIPPQFLPWGVVPLTENVVWLKGQSHVDPMFEVVNAPSRHEAVVVPTLIEFALDNIQ